MVSVPVKKDQTVEFGSYDPVNALMQLLDSHWNSSYFVTDAKVVYSEDNERIYSTPDTCNWWNIAQVVSRGIVFIFLVYI